MGTICSGGEVDVNNAKTLGNEVKDRAHPDGASGYSFVDEDLKFPTDGKVVGWRYFAGRAGATNLRVVRRSGTSTTFAVIGITTHTAVVGMNEITLDAADYIEVCFHFSFKSG